MPDNESASVTELPTPPPALPGGRPLSAEDKRAIEVGLREGKSYSQLGRELGRVVSVVASVAHRLGHHRPQGGGSGVRMTAEVQKRIIAQNKQGHSMRQISLNVGVSDSTVARVLRRNNVVVNSSTGRPRRDVDTKAIQRLYHQGVKVTDIAKQFQTTQATVYNRLGSIKAIKAQSGRKLSDVARARISEAQKARWARVKKIGSPNLGQGAIPTVEITKRNGFYHCPECSVKYSEKRFLGRHRSTVHGIKPSGKSTLYALQRKEKEKEAQELEEVQPQPKPNGREEIHVHQPNPDNEINTHCAYLFGKFQGELQGYADSQDIPWKVLASGVARLFEYSTASVRQRVGSTHRVRALRGETT